MILIQSVTFFHYYFFNFFRVNMVTFINKKKEREREKVSTRIRKNFVEQQTISMNNIYRIYTTK